MEVQFENYCNLTKAQLKEKLLQLLETLDATADRPLGWYMDYLVKPTGEVEIHIDPQ